MKSPFESRKKQKVAQALAAYQEGQINKINFITKLKANDIEINHQLNALIKKNESGDT